jgi:mevalonate kinase
MILLSNTHRNTRSIPSGKQLKFSKNRASFDINTLKGVFARSFSPHICSNHPVFSRLLRQKIALISPHFHTHPRGKLLISGEYAVLDGALALAVPTRAGQLFAVHPGNGPEDTLIWRSLDTTGKPWFEGTFSLPSFHLIQSSARPVGVALQELLQIGWKLRQAAADGLPSRLAVTCTLEFPRDWGLGSSSTLIAAVARWFNVNPFQLLADTFGGSGYDIACAYAEGPLLYKSEGEQATIQPVAFCPPFRDNLLFIHLGKKQDSRAGIRYYREQLTDTRSLVRDLSDITLAMCACTTLSDFEALLLEHESRVSEALNLDRTQALYFPTFKGVVKSLGAWGGDFVLATSRGNPTETAKWFHDQGFPTVLTWDNMILPTLTPNAPS